MSSGEKTTFLYCIQGASLQTLPVLLSNIVLVLRNTIPGEGEKEFTETSNKQVMKHTHTHRIHDGAKIYAEKHTLVKRTNQMLF